MATISSRDLVDTVLRVERLGLQERGRLAEEVCARQPNLFFSVLVLQRFGATLEQLEVVLNLLLVLHEAMKSNGRSWPVISEDVQERCLKRISGRVSASFQAVTSVLSSGTTDPFNVSPQAQAQAQWQRQWPWLSCWAARGCELFEVHVGSKVLTD